MRNDLNVPTKNNGADSLELYLFKEQCPPSEHIKSSFRSECPPDKKVKLDNLFEFRRKRGDFVFSVIFLVVALFFLGSFFTETGWHNRKSVSYTHLTLPTIYSV